MQISKSSSVFEIFFMTSQLDSYRTTDIKSEILSGVQTRNGTPHDKYNIRGIAHLRTNRKDDISMQRRLYIDEAHTALDIFRFAVFLFILLGTFFLFAPLMAYFGFNEFGLLICLI